MIILSIFLSGEHGNNVESTVVQTGISSSIWNPGYAEERCTKELVSYKLSK